MGLEIPNERREIVTLGEIIKSTAYDEISSPLALALGKDIGGAPIVADLQRMPHLLIAGTTGSGKSVGINAMVLSLQEYGTGCAAHHDRSQDVGTVGVRGYPASFGPRCDGYEASLECAALVCRRNGTTLPVDGGDGRS